MFGGFILLGAVAFLEWRRNGKQRHLWRWIALAISILAVTALIAIWAGEYRFENGQRPNISN
jgi:4-amino-4-deoxy-L-arabinose transferase-like glycosyltransferase